MARMNFDANMRAVSIVVPQNLDVGDALIQDIDFQHCLRGVLLVHIGTFAGTSPGTLELTLYTSDETGISDTSDLIPVWTDSDGDAVSETFTQAADEEELHTVEIGDAVRRYLYLAWEVAGQNLDEVSISAVGWHAPHKPVRDPS